MAVIAINAAMFFVEMSAGFWGGSQALKADALDFAGDTTTYALSLAVIGASLRVRSMAALIKGASLALMTLFVLTTTVAAAFGEASPAAPIMSGVGLAALAANVASVLILLRWRDGDSNIRSVWLCSRNDAIGNIGVIAAGGAVWITGSFWPDLIVAALLATLFLKSSAAITSQALKEINAATNRPANSHTPPLGHAFLTPLYDFAIRWLTRERYWHQAFIADIAPKRGEKIIDVGSGTGSLVVAIHAISPETTYIGIDPDEEAVRRARAKAARINTLAKFEVGYFSAGDPLFAEPPDKIVCSLVLHQVPVAEKYRIAREIFNSLKPGGSVHIADYGLQSGLQRKLFRMTVQALDGVENTQPNADGILPSVLSEAGFTDVVEAETISTLTGSISIFRASKPTKPKQGLKDETRDETNDTARNSGADICSAELGVSKTISGICD